MCVNFGYNPKTKFRNINRYQKVAGRYIGSDLEKVRLEKRCETVVQALQVYPEGKCKLYSTKAWIMVSS